MHLTYRPATAQDVEACLEMLPPGFVCGASCRARLADAWRNWLREGIMQMTVLEDGMRPSVSRRIAFGNSVFVTEAFAQETKASLPPPLGVQVVRRWSEGRSPVLDLRALRAANSGPGLTLLILHIGWMPRLTAEEVRWAKGKLLEALLFFFSGYQLKEVLQEVYSEEERQRGMAAGAHLKNDYYNFYRAHPEALPTPECRPYLLGGSRAETADGSYLSPLFFYHPPRFFFKIGEQEVLRLALLDRSDEEASDILSVSPSTVQKRWRTIYERVSAAEPGFFPSEGAFASNTRGAAKRPHLLGYLRSHPEELRPVNPPKPSSPKFPRSK